VFPQNQMKTTESALPQSPRAQQIKATEEAKEARVILGVMQFFRILIDPTYFHAFQAQKFSIVSPGTYKLRFDKFLTTIVLREQKDMEMQQRGAGDVPNVTIDSRTKCKN
jgi:hypothetical protein